MRRYLRPHYLWVIGGMAIGLAIGVFVVNAEPAILGWAIGGGLGLSGGAYLAAITSGEPLVGGGSGRASNWTLGDLYGDEDEAVAPKSPNGH